MKVAVLAETAAGETRVAAIPETVKKMVALGAAVAVEQGAGRSAGISDQDYADAGATVVQVSASRTGEEASSSSEAPSGEPVVLREKKAGE